MRYQKKTAIYQCPLDHPILLALVCSTWVIVAVNWVRADEGEGASILLVLVWEISVIVAINWARADEGQGAEVAEAVVVQIGGRLGSCCR